MNINKEAEIIINDNFEDNSNINEVLLCAAQNSLSSFLMELGWEKNNEKVLELSFLVNSFIYFSEDFNKRISQSNQEELIKCANNIYTILSNNSKYIEAFSEYSEHIAASFILSIGECYDNLPNFKESEIHINLILHFLAMIPFQNKLNTEA